MKKEIALILSTGFALFSMFFGSGNLVFPIGVGLESGGHYVAASLGILSTGVIFPILGMIGMTLYDGKIERFFHCFGKKGIFLFTLLALSLMGPFGVLARCLTVMHGAWLLLFPEAPLALTSLGFCFIIFLLTLNKSRILTLLGTWLTPFLLVSIGAIVYSAMSQAHMQEPANAEIFKAFKNGFFQGYQTMDLVASFFFSGFVINHLSKSESSSRLRIFLKASSVGAALLFIVYFSLVTLGWLYAPVLANMAPQEMLGAIALASLGKYAAPCVGLAVVFACLTTAMALASLFADFLREQVAQDKIRDKTSLLITLGIAFFVSTLDFNGIAGFLGPLLEMIYPALITLTVVNIASHAFGLKTTHWPFTLTIASKLLWV